MCSAGVTCHAWSAEGSAEGCAHESEVPLGIWIAERVHRFEECLEDVAFLECTPRFPAQSRLEKAFGSSAKVLAWVDGPQRHGWPHRRSRVLAVIVNLKTAEWLGPPDVASAKADYAARFYRQRVSHGAMLMQAGESERVCEMQALATGRKNNTDRSTIQQLVQSGDLEALAQLILPPGDISRLESWKELYNEKLADDLCCVLSSATSTTLLVVKAGCLPVICVGLVTIVLSCAP